MGPIKVENLIARFGNSYYELFAAKENSQRIVFSYLFTVEEEINKTPAEIKREELTRNGVSTTEKPDEFMMDVILENTSE